MVPRAELKFNMKKKKKIKLKVKIEDLEIALSRWQRYASYLNSCAKCGDHNIVEFNDFVIEQNKGK